MNRSLVFGAKADVPCSRRRTGMLAAVIAALSIAVAVTATRAEAEGTFAIINQAEAGIGFFSVATQPLTGDFNGDGATDIAVINSDTRSISVAFSTTDGGFHFTNQPMADFVTWATSPNVKVLVGDFNRDGKSDIALTGGSGWTTLPVAFSNGDGTFRVTNLPIGAFAAWATMPNVSVLVGDFDQDGRTDIALTGVAGWTTLPVAFSNGDGTFRVTNTAIGDFAGWAATANVKVLAGDFDGDGKTDIALTGASGWTTLPVAFSNGDGSFRVINSPIGDFATWASTTGARILVGDFDGDGTTDVLLTGPVGWTTVPVAFSNGDGTFRVTNKTNVDIATRATTPIKILVGDVNNDGKSDLVLTGNPGWFYIPVGFSKGDGSFRSSFTNSQVVGFAQWAAADGTWVLIGDFNKDGRSDLALLSKGSPPWGAAIPVAFSMFRLDAVKPPPFP
jgi:hypothetical protein